MIFAMRGRSVDEVKVIALSWQAKVRAATVKTGLNERGVRGRQMIHQALGFLAPPQGQTDHVNLPLFPGPEDGEGESTTITT